MENSYCDGLRVINPSQYPSWIKEELALIEQSVEAGSLSVYDFSDNCYAIRFELKVPIPSRGTQNNTDIRSREPIFILVDKDFSIYKYQSPWAFSDRIDFPVDDLPHLNPLPKPFPANFCLHRGSTNEWFTEHTLADFIDRIQCWLRDAAGGNLIKGKDGDRFEITRITKSEGYHIYQNNDFIKAVSKSHYCLYKLQFVGKEYRGNDNLVSLHSSVCSVDDVGKITEISKAYVLGLLIRANERQVFSKYCSRLPEQYSELIQFGNQFGVDIKFVVGDFISRGALNSPILPITIAIKRPLKLIQYDTDIEFLNFVVIADKDESDAPCIKETSPVCVLEHREPNTLEFSRKLSDNSKVFAKKSIFMGGGAVGSKLLLHLTKSGFNNIDVVDNDKMSPHNLIRHGLLSSSVGLYKAEQLVDEIKGIFPYDESIKIEAHNVEGAQFLNSRRGFSGYSDLIDATASNSFQMYLSDYDFKSPAIKCSRCELANNGKLGIFKKEGNGRNPRLDELNIALLDQAVEADYISNWLRNNDDKMPEFEDISIGVGCNSNTLKLSDDVISLHTAFFSLAIRNNINSKSGFVELSKIEDKNTFCITSERFEVGKFERIKFQNGKDWVLHIKADIVALLHSELNAHLPNETGGLILGKLDVKRKLIFVTRIITEPSDSKSTPDSFTMGTNGVLETINHCRDRTAGIIDYVGEWHTHPGGSSSPSHTDIIAVKNSMQNLQQIPMPVFILIVTKTKIHPYIY